MIEEFGEVPCDEAIQVRHGEEFLVPERGSYGEAGRSVLKGAPRLRVLPTVDACNAIHKTKDNNPIDGAIEDSQVQCPFSTTVMSFHVVRAPTTLPVWNSSQVVR